MVWDNPVVSAPLTVDGDWEAFDDGTNALVIALDPRELIDLVVSIASAVGETDDLEVQVLAGNRISNGNGLADASSATVVGLNAADQKQNDYYNGMYFLMTSGGETKELREISNYDNASNDVTLLRALSGTPSAAETYAIYHMRPVAQFLITAETTMTEDLPQNGGITLTGYPYVIVRARATGATDAHIAVLSYSKDGVAL